MADQMNARRSLSMMPNAHSDRQSAIDVCIGTAERVDLTSSVRPAALRSCPFLPGILLATLSIKGCSSERLSL